MTKKKESNISELLERYEELVAEQKNDRDELNRMDAEITALEEEYGGVDGKCERRTEELQDLKEKIKIQVDSLAIDFS